MYTKYLTDCAQRNAFLETRRSIETRYKIEKENGKQVIKYLSALEHVCTAFRVCLKLVINYSFHSLDSSIQIKTCMVSGQIEKPQKNEYPHQWSDSQR